MALYKTLVKKISIPADKKTKQKEYLSKGDLPIIDQGHALIGGYSDDISKKIECVYPVIIFGDHTKCVKLIGFPFGAGADGIKILQPKEGVSAKYLYYGTQYLTLKIEDKGYARHYQHIEKKILPVPSLPEQERIVTKIEELLSQFDSGVETLRKTKQQLSIYRQAITEDAASRAKAEANTISPFSYCVKYFQNGISKRSGDGLDTIVLRLADIKKQQIAINNEFRKIGLTTEERERFLLQNGDLLIIRVNGSTNNVGRVIVIDKDDQYTVCDHFIRCVVDKDVILPEFVQLMFNTNSSRKYIKENMVSSAGQNTVSQTTIKNAGIFIPSIKVQSLILQEVEEKFSICDSIEQTVDTALQQSKALRQSILKEAFEGRLI